LKSNSISIAKRTTRAWYAASIAEFLVSQPDQIVGRLAINSTFEDSTAQKEAWRFQIELLQGALTGLRGTILFEFNIPRMGRRIDVVLLVGSVLFVVEFKVGEAVFDRAAVEQVWDYALDLKNFHEASHAASIVPVLVATAASARTTTQLHADPDRVYRPVLVGATAFRELVDQALRSVSGEVLDGDRWPTASYRPTPTIIEAARALYAQHSVDEIARYDAGARNLRLTSNRIEEIVDSARLRHEKVICFVTGVPGAGKTLVGLNIATHRRDSSSPTHAVFLSGNGPLVAVLREALTRDEVERQRSSGTSKRRGEVAESVKAFIQNVHHFRDDAIADRKPPVERVVIFDEAQRAWDLQRTASFMKQRKGLPGFSQSEPEFLISCMDRHNDWAVIVCLVGGGQEIHLGEAGIDTWLEAIRRQFPDWKMHISSRLTDSEYAAGKALDLVRGHPNVQLDGDLHLAVSMRSFRAESVSGFVKAILDCEVEEARAALKHLRGRYPVVVTRDLGAAKQWLRAHARGSERFGLVTSSKAQRLKPHAIDVRVQVDPVHWFLSGREDTRSSYYLEDAATEFQVQGLEVDWACVAWDGDLRFTGSGWSCHDFRGSKWCNIKNSNNSRYVRNAYRVLLTRARQGMVIFVPQGAADDPTRAPEFYNSTFQFLTGIGIPTLDPLVIDSSPT